MSVVLMRFEISPAQKRALAKSMGESNITLDVVREEINRLVDERFAELVAVVEGTGAKTCANCGKPPAQTLTEEGFCEKCEFVDEEEEGDDEE